MRAKYPDEEGFVEREGVRLHYEIYGKGEHTILFVPTWSMVHSRAYKAQIPYFSEHFRVVTWDPRGNGLSDRPEEPEAYGLEQFVEDAVFVMDQTKTDRAILFGFSFSGLVSAILAANYPERFEALIAIGSVTPLIAPNKDRTPDAFNARRDRYEGWQKFNRHYWQQDYPGFVDFFMRQIFIEPHSTKQTEDSIGWALETNGDIIVKTMDGRWSGKIQVDEAMYRRIRCPVLLIHGDSDPVATCEASRIIAELTGGELLIVPGSGHGPHARYPAKVNTSIRDFLARHLGTWQPKKTGNGRKHGKKALYLSSPIGLGHGRRDLAVARELRRLRPELSIDWLAQDPVTRFLQANNETIHPASKRLANESRHIEEEAGEHDLHAFQALRRMDEILIANFMTFQEVVEEGDYDLIVADEAWDVDHYWHEHPELKKAQLAWFTDFVGWVPMPEGGDYESFLTTDYNEEMIKHIEDHPEMRDRAIFVGNPGDIVPLGFGKDLPEMRDWIPKHFDFSGYILGEHPDRFGPREELRRRLGYREDEKVCIVTVGGSGVGAPLIRRILAAWPIVQRSIPELRMIVVAGPRINPASLQATAGVEIRAFVPDLDRHLAACDLAVVQGGLTTCMELAAAGTPFLYFPLQNHFEQNFHVAHRLDQYGAGRRMDYATSDPDRIATAIIEELGRGRAKNRPVEADGAVRAAAMLAEML